MEAAGPKIDHRISETIEEYFTTGAWSSRVQELANQFQKEQYIELRDFAPAAIQAAAFEEIGRLLRLQSRRRDVLIPESGNSPRSFTSVGWDKVDQHGSVIPSVYFSAAVQKLLCVLAGEYIAHVPFPPERYLITHMHKAGDTHGWHWDDYSYVLVWIMQAPAQGVGGTLEYIRNTTPRAGQEEIESIVRNGAIERRRAAQGSAYFFRTDTSLHRVSPLSEGEERIIISMAFANSKDLRSPASHGSWQSLFDDVPSIEQTFAG